MVLTALGGVAVVFFTGLVGWYGVRSLHDVLAPPGTSASERVPFVGGYPMRVHAWSRFHARYYAMALLFLAFDMEMVFMYPWAVVFAREGLKALVEMVMFIAILLLGIAYAWRERAFDWA